MRVILNSDVLFWQRPPRGLPRHVREFCQQSAAVGAIVVIPRTVVLECQRAREDAADRHKEELRDAATMLRELGVDVPPFDPDALGAAEDLRTLLEQAGARVEVVDATHQDFVEAERRASLHLSPAPPAGSKSDEMRDLVIWVVSLRIASNHGGAILVSRDDVHIGDRGGEEASAIGLLRVSSLDGALELLGRVTPVGQLARTLLATVWEPLRHAGLPIPQEVAIAQLSDVSFVSDATGHVSGSFSFATPTAGGSVRASATIRQGDPGRTEVRLDAITVDEAPWKDGKLSVEVDGELPLMWSPTAERLTELRSVIGEGA